MPHSAPSQAEVEARLREINQSDPRNRLYGLNRAALGEAFELTRGSRAVPGAAPAPSSRPNPDVVNESFGAALPIASGRGEFARTQAFQSTVKRYGEGSVVSQAYALMEDRPEANGMGYDVTSGKYYDPTSYNNLAVDDRTNATGPAPITQRPTSTTNPKRPRTVAAGYDPERKTLTVVFRDGTFYNYYDVSKHMWNSFKSATSKGKYIRRYLDAKPRGDADMSFLSKQAAEMFYRVSRTNQILFDGHQGMRPKRQPKVQADLYRGATPGKNPSKGGSNPAQRRKP
jgi:hypothetical protein